MRVSGYKRSASFLDTYGTDRILPKRVVPREELVQAFEKLCEVEDLNNKNTEIVRLRMELRFALEEIARFKLPFYHKLLTFMRSLC